MFFRLRPRTWRRLAIHLRRPVTSARRHGSQPRGDGSANLEWLETTADVADSDPVTSALERFHELSEVQAQGIRAW